MVWFSLRVREVPSSILGMPPIFSIFFPYSVVAINLLLIVHQEKMINEDHTRGKFLSCYLLLSYCCLIQKGWNTNPNANWLIKYLIQIQYRNWIETGQSKSIYYYTCQTLKFPWSVLDRAHYQWVPMYQIVQQLNPPLLCCFYPSIIHSWQRLLSTLSAKIDTRVVPNTASVQHGGS